MPARPVTRTDCETAAEQRFAAIRHELDKSARCIKTTSCEPGDHTYSWPCELARTD